MMFSRKQLVSLIVPLIVEQVFLGTIGIADMLMVAPVGEVAISGISLVNSINMLFHSVFSALAAGGSILCIQYNIGQTGHYRSCERNSGLSHASEQSAAGIKQHNTGICKCR